MFTEQRIERMKKEATTPDLRHNVSVCYRDADKSESRSPGKDMKQCPAHYENVVLTRGESAVGASNYYYLPETKSRLSNIKAALFRFLKFQASKLKLSHFKVESFPTLQIISSLLKTFVYRRV